MSTWHPTPSPYNDNSDHRPPPPDPNLQQPYHPPPGYAPPPRDVPPYPQPESSYGRQGSVSTPARSPAETHAQRYPPTSASHESPYYPPGAPDYHHRQPGPYGGPEAQPNGIHQPLHVQTGPDMMTGPPPPGHHPPPHGYGPPPPQSAGPPTPGGYYSSHQYYDNQQQRRKPVRAAQACDSCRSRKAKCDEGRPECSHCKDNGLKCFYREAPAPKTDKQMMAVTERLESLSDSVKAMSDNVRELMQGQKMQQDHIRTLFDGQKLPPRIRSEETQINPRDQSPDALEYSMPPKHTTAVHNLFEWPSIKELIPPDTLPSYVMDFERGRGLLRLHGCGEGEDKYDGHEGAPASPAASSPSDTSSASPQGVWGTGHPSPPTTANEPYTPRDHPGGLSSRGGLSLDCDTVDSLFKSYMDNLHILHPFLEAKVLRQMLSTFKKKYSWNYYHPASMVGTKRKHESTESSTSADDMLPTQRHSRLDAAKHIEHSISNAIILLVMALGKVCLHRAPLPAAPHSSSIRTSTPLPNHVALSGLGSPSPRNGQMNGAHTPLAVSGPNNAQGKNMDVIPGLAYFTLAADILGELAGGTEISHVQANILAGLYMGQLARVIASHTYISAACRVCQILIESSEYKEKRMSRNRRDLVNFAFWTCLQLESDILAEVDLPPSGITRYEGSQWQEVPKGITLEQINEHGDSSDLLNFYSSQIQLRRTMNDIHSTLYKHDKKDHSKPDKGTRSLRTMETVYEGLANWRTLIGKIAGWEWDDNDHMHPNINVARMRAKYYGAKYITFRPALRYILAEASRAANATPTIKHSSSPQGYTQSPSRGSMRPGDMGPPATMMGDEELVLDYSEKCVEAAIRSTTVFDMVPPRIIVTNIFGTAHAQFGNVLVLSATFNSSRPQLKAMVDEYQLRHLFERTIKILDDHANVSPILQEDARILRHVRSRLFPHEFPPGSAVSSFSGR